MKRFMGAIPSLAIISFILLSVITGNISAQAPPIGYMGLYTDEARTANEVEIPAPYVGFTVWVYCLPSDNGMLCAEFALEIPPFFLEIGFVPNPDISVALGTLQGGMSVCFNECQTDWTWTHQLSILPVTTDPDKINIVRNPDTGACQFSDCGEGGGALEQVFRTPPLCVNMSCPPDTDPPVITDLVVSDDSNFRLFLNEEMYEPDLETLSNYHVYDIIHPDDSIEVAWAMADSPEYRSVRMSLASPMNSSVVYRLKPRNIRDIGGNFIVAGTSVEFGTADFTPPEALSAVATSDTSCIIYFSEPLMENDAEVPGNYLISDLSGVNPVIVPSTAEYLSDSNAVLLISPTRFEPHADHQIAIMNVCDIAGNAVPAGHSVTFMAPDNISPDIELLSVSSSNSLVIRFDEPIDPSTSIQFENYRIFETDDPSAVMVLWSILYIPDSRVRLTFLHPFTPETSYTVTVTGVEDVYGNGIMSPGVTGSFIFEDIWSPSLLSIAAIDITHIRIVYSEPMDAVTVQEPANYEVFMQDLPENVLSISAVTLEAGDTSVVVETGDPINTGTYYRVRATNVEDAWGNVIGPYNNASFMIPDLEPPYIVDVIPVSLEILDVQFNEFVEESSAEEISNYLVHLTSSTGDSVPVTGAVLGNGGNTVRLDLEWQLSEGGSYTIVLENIEDYAGNIVPPGYSYEFDAMDNTPPAIRELAFLASDRLQLIFEEPVTMASSGDPASYGLYESNSPTEILEIYRAETSGFNDRVVLSLYPVMQDGTGYTVVIPDVTDLSGNIAGPEGEVEFIYDLTNMTTRMGLYVDSEHRYSFVKGTVPYLLDLYVWVLPGSTGAICSQYSLEIPSGCSVESVEVNPGYSVLIGDPLNGVSICFPDCMNNWFWTHHLVLRVDSTESSFVTIEKHPEERQIIVATCEDGYPVGDVEVCANLEINCERVPPRLISANSTGGSLVNVVFNEEIDQAIAEDGSNYTIIPAWSPETPLTITNAQLLPDLSSVQLIVQESLAMFQSYVVYVSNVENSDGIAIDTGSNYLFVVMEYDPPLLVSGEMSGQQSVKVVFDEVLNEASAETEGFYSVFRDDTPGIPLTILGATFSSVDKSVELSLQENIIHDVLYTVGVENVTDIGGNPVAPGSEISFVADDIYPPSISNAGAISPDTVVVVFNESMDPLTSGDFSNYSVAEADDPTAIIPVTGAIADDTSVRLSLAIALNSNVAYTVTVNGVADIAGNQLPEGLSARRTFVFDQTLPYAAIGLYVDELRSARYVEAAPYEIFDIYVFCNPGPSGIICAEYSIGKEYYASLGWAVISEVHHSDMSVSIGDCINGLSICLKNCYYSWQWVTHLQVLYLGGEGEIYVLPHPDTGEVSFANCQTGLPMETATVIQSIGVNNYDPPVATMLENSSVSYVGDAVEIEWTLSSESEIPNFSISRNEGTTNDFIILDSAGISRVGREFSFSDGDVQSGKVYRYRVDFSDDGETHILFETEAVETPVMVLTLNQNRPNPFNPTTTISYHLPEAVSVLLEVFDVSGRRINILENGLRSSGEHSVDWDGLDSGGNRVSSGIYFYRLTAGKETVSRKMVLMR